MLAFCILFCAAGVVTIAAGITDEDGGFSSDLSSYGTDELVKTWNLQWIGYFENIPEIVTLLSSMARVTSKNDFALSTAGAQLRKGLNKVLIAVSEALEAVNNNMLAIKLDLSVIVGKGRLLIGKISENEPFEKKKNLLSRLAESIKRHCAESSDEAAEAAEAMAKVNIQMQKLHENLLDSAAGDQAAIVQTGYNIRDAAFNITSVKRRVAYQDRQFERLNARIQEGITDFRAELDGIPTTAQSRVYKFVSKFTSLAATNHWSNAELPMGPSIRELMSQLYKIIEYLKISITEASDDELRRKLRLYGRFPQLTMDILKTLHGSKVQEAAFRIAEEASEYFEATETSGRANIMRRLDTILADISALTDAADDSGVDGASDGKVAAK